MNSVFKEYICELATLLSNNNLYSKRNLKLHFDDIIPYCIDKDGNNNSNMIATLPLYSRTPVNKCYSERIGDIYILKFGL